MIFKILSFALNSIFLDLQLVKSCIKAILDWYPHGNVNRLQNSAAAVKKKIGIFTKHIKYYKINMIQLNFFFQKRFVYNLSFDLNL